MQVLCRQLKGVFAFERQLVTTQTLLLLHFNFCRTTLKNGKIYDAAIRCAHKIHGQLVTIRSGPGTQRKRIPDAL
jgi:hypothetical protein